MDYSPFIIGGAPIVVALVAVWLGYQYQLTSLDRETRRRAYLDAVSCLRRMAVLIEHAEQLNYVTWTVGQEADRMGNPKSKEVGPEILALLVRLLTVGEYAKVSPDWSLLDDPSRPEAVKLFVRIPGQIMRARSHSGF